MNKKLWQPIRPMFIVFILVNVLAVTSQSLLVKYNFSQDVLILGNLLLFMVMLVSYFMTFRSLHSSNPQAFIRSMYGSFMIKFFFLAIAAFAYIMVVKKQVNKEGLAACGLLYIVYTFIEIKALMNVLKGLKQSPHA